jgi:hypothetical protein
MTPQAQIKARFAEEAAAFGVKVSVQAKKSPVDGTAFYLNLTGVGNANRTFISRILPDAMQTSGSGAPPPLLSYATWRVPAKDVPGILAETQLDPEWLKANDSAVLRIVRGIREDEAFERLPILADALEEAGCTNRTILEHCRASAPHKEPCWVVELLVAAAAARKKGGE